MTQWAMSEPWRVQCHPASQFEVLIAGAQASGVTMHLFVLLTVPGRGAASVQPLVSKSRDSVTTPLGHSLVFVLYLDPTMPGPHASTVDAIGILKGTHASESAAVA
jgi:hypothetical protein